MTDMQLARPVALPARVGQATAIEQSRAAAEVYAAVVVAQQCPRSVPAAVAAMRESCSQLGLAERAFFRFKRGTTSVNGPSVHLARDLARCWGNIQSGLAELRRDDAEGISEMQAWAWDVQTNSRVSTTFVVPHMRDKTGGAVPLTELRDIYENNANQGARRLREMIFAILPPWYVEDAKQRCMATLRDGEGVPLPKRIANLISIYDQKGVTTAQLEAKIGAVVAGWTEHDVAQLLITGRSLDRGEVRLEDEFPRTTAADVIDRMRTPAPAAEVAENSRPLDTEHAPPAKAARAKAADKPADEKAPRGEDWPEVVQPPKPEGGQR